MKQIQHQDGSGRRVGYTRGPTEGGGRGQHGAAGPEQRPVCPRLLSSLGSAFPRSGRADRGRRESAPPCNPITLPFPRHTWLVSFQELSTWPFVVLTSVRRSGRDPPSQPPSPPRPRSLGSDRLELEVNSGKKCSYCPASIN